MKKIIVLLTLIITILTLSSCQENNVDEISNLQIETIISEDDNTENIKNQDLLSNNNIPNEPKLVNGMIGIYWDTDGNEKMVTNDNLDSWYEYISSTNNNSSKWANAKTSDGSYWVWIPRFEYKLDEKNQKIDINFIETNQTTPTNGFKIHPAFQDGSNNNFINGEWDNELSGFWVAKYEMSNNSQIPASVPGVTSWRDISIEDSFFKSQSIKTNVKELDNINVDTHLMKNSEWGAVAYLTYSSYGINGTEITVNTDNSYITGGSIGATALTNQNQSTTSNETGVYDMVGGAWERMASYMSNGHENITRNASSIPNIVTSRNEQGYVNQSTKYLTVYPFADDNNIENNYQSYANLSTLEYGYGDAILEVSTNGSGSTSWNNDFSNYLFTDDIFILRGGSYFNGLGAGIFAFNSAGGGANSHLGFRCVLVIED